MDSERLKITLCAIGSRGDVQPFISLGLVLIQKGFQVKIATEDRLKPLVEEFGIGECTSEAHFLSIIFRSSYRDKNQSLSFLRFVLFFFVCLEFALHYSTPSTHYSNSLFTFIQIRTCNYNW
jgi:hypothetical protein